MNPILVYILFFLNISFVCGQHRQKLNYDIPLEDLVEINIVKDSLNYSRLEPTYELSINDLMNLEIIKQLEVEQNIGLTYDIPLKDLMKLELTVHKNEKAVNPSYEMSMEGLMELNIIEDYYVIESVNVTYDISLDGLMKITIKD